MATLERAVYSGGLFISAGMAAIWWLYLEPSAKPLINKYAGPFSDQWELLKWVFPTACLILMFAAGLYLVYGGVQEERKAERRVRGRP